MEGDIEYLQRRVNEERRQTSYGPALPVDWAAVAALLKEVERLREIEANVDRVTAEWSRRCQELEEENNRLRAEVARLETKYENQATARKGPLDELIDEARNRVKDALL